MTTTKVFSRQDKDISTASLLTSRRVEYKDIDLSFAAKPNGELYVKKDASAVVQAIKNLIQTNHFEKPFLPKFGGNIREFLFELAYDDIKGDIKNNIIRAIQTYEPRAQLIDVFVSGDLDAGSVVVKITFYVRNAQQPIELDVILKRNR